MSCDLELCAEVYTEPGMCCMSMQLTMLSLTVIISATVAQFVDRIGRRPLWLISTGGMLGAYVIITALSATFAKTQVHSTGLAVIPFLFIFFGF